MMRKSVVSAASLAALAGSALAQPVVDGVYDPGTEGSFYSSVLWSQNQPTAFGDNEAGEFTGGDFGDPPGDVMTGVEICIPLTAIGGALESSGGTSAFQLAGWVNSGDRTFMSNQLIHAGDLPIDTNNLGGAPDFTALGGTQHASMVANVGAIVVDGQLDANYGSAQFLQTNFTGFGDSTDGTEIGGGGSEIDAVYAATDGVNLYLFIAGNLEANGNGLDLYIDADASAGTGSTVLGSGSGAGGFIVDGQSGLVFDAGFGADFVVSADAWNDDGDDGTTPNVPRLHAGPIGGSIDDQGSLAGYGSSNAGALSNGYALGVDNSNTAGVIGTASQSSPMAPDADWGYGSELNNVRAYIDNSEGAMGRLYVFVGANAEANFNKINFFIDCAPGGQGTLRNDNIDISFNGLNRMADLVFDPPFTANYWLNVNMGVDGGTGNLQNYVDAAVIRTDGVLLDPFFLLTADYGSFFGGFVTDGTGAPVMDPVQLMDFSGPQFDEQDGFLANLYSNYAPAASVDVGLDILMGNLPSGSLPPAGLLEVNIDNSNVGGVTAVDAPVPSVADAPNVNTGIEFSVDLAELGWDGEQDILLAGWVASGGFDFLSNQVIGGLPASDNLGEVSLVDFSAIDGTQYVNLSAVPGGCNDADLAEPYDVLDFSDVLAFLTAFGGMDPAADLAAPFGTFDFSDVIAFLGAFGTGCP
jgi:hypothetical protein